MAATPDASLTGPTSVPSGVMVCRLMGVNELGSPKVQQD